MKKMNLRRLLWGAGIAFHKKVGDYVDETKVDKVFSLVNQDINLKLQQLLKDIPMEYIEITEKIVGMLRLKHQGVELFYLYHFA